MIKFDKFESEQTYQGYTHLAIRTYGISKDAAMLQEPVTNEIFRLMGLPATQTAYAGVQINNEPELLFVISEVINSGYINSHFTGTNGVLYKAELGADLRYRGEDPSAYATSFSQKTRLNDADMAPLIRLLRFISQADDQTFESELDDYLDVDSLAAYLAVNALLVNSDSLAGMSNNYYLYYNDVTEQFTLLMWDANESLGKLAFNGQAATTDIYLSNKAGLMAGGGMNRSNQLVTRFMSIPSFVNLYEQKLLSIYQEAFGSGTIFEIVDRYTTVVQEANQQRNLVNAESYQQAVKSTINFLHQRDAYLTSTQLIGNFSSSDE